jgi:hypothetical protein
MVDDIYTATERRMMPGEGAASIKDEQPLIRPAGRRYAETPDATPLPTQLFKEAAGNGAAGFSVLILPCATYSRQAYATVPLLEEVLSGSSSALSSPVDPEQ